KTTAKNAIEDAATAKKAAIDARNELTQEEKDAAKKEVDDKAKEAKANVDSATTNAEVDTAKIAGQAVINAFNPPAEIKNNAKAEIDKIALAKKAEIDDRSDLTAEEKEVAKRVIDLKVLEIKHAIDIAITNAEVEAAKQMGIDNIGEFHFNSDSKTLAKDAIEQAVKVKKAEIDARNDLTAEEKSAAKELVDATANKARQDIDNATNQADVLQAISQGVDAIMAINPIAKSRGKLLPYTGEASTLLPISFGSTLLPLGLFLLWRKRNEDEE
ncbi:MULTISPECIES: DUF1542 domain-containing protein, partial [unclassified Granulicatella]|uniref:DUF1542 domain-containing protein n=1 Tax=unclassified Granulicatella TaxID=2630493 RepID=UPI001074460E